MGGGRCGWLVFHTEVSWGTGVNKGICVFYWWLHYHLRRDSKSPQSLEKERRLHILTNQARNDFRDNGSFAICYEVCPELLKLVEGHAQVGHFLFPPDIAKEGEEVLWQLLRYYEGRQYSLCLLSARVICLLRKVSNSSLLCQTGWSLVLVFGN